MLFREDLLLKKLVVAQGQHLLISEVQISDSLTGNSVCSLVLFLQTIKIPAFEQD